MKDCAKDIEKYHSDRVLLTGRQRIKLRDRRDANRTRLGKGLDRNEKPRPEKFVTQGSYAMKTTIQELDHNYDIDDGVVFARASLKGSQGADMRALDSRKMVRDAVDDGSFKRDPEIKPNCVRVF